MDGTNGNRPPEDRDDPSGYVPPPWEGPDGPSRTTAAAGRDSPDDRAGGTNALDAVLDALERDDTAVVLVSGGSGLGKSRLLAAVGRALRERGDVRVHDVGNAGDEPEPPFEGETVVLLDDAGRTDDAERILHLAAGDGQSSDSGGTVRVVAAVHPVYGALLEPAIPVAVDPSRVALGTLDPDGTVELLSDLDVPPGTAREIHDVTGGHPGLARLLAHAADGDGDGGPSPEALLADVTERAGPPEGDAAAVRSGVVGEFRRYRALSEGTGPCEEPVEGHRSTAPVDVARGLVELRASPLARFDFFDGEAVAGRTDELLGDIASRVVESDAPLADALRVGAVVGLVAPDAIPHDDLAERYADDDPGPTVARHLQRLVAVCYRGTGATAADAGRSAATPAAVENARMWLGRLDVLATGHPENDEVRRRLARALRDAASHERAAGRIDALRTCVDRLDALANDHPDDASVRRPLARASGIVVAAEGSAGRFDALESRLDRLDALAGEHPDDGTVRTALATALVTATSHAGDADRLDALDARLDRLEGLAGAHPDDGGIRRRLARALLNATSAEGAAGRFDAVDARLDRLEELASARPDDEIRHRLSQALLNAVNHESAVGRFDAIDARLDRLAGLVEENPHNADVRLRFAQALLTAVNREGEAGRLDDLRSRLDALRTLATDHPDHGAIRVPTTGAHVIAIRRFVDAERYESASETVADLADVERSLGGLRVGGKGKDVGELAERTGEHLIRNERLDLLEDYVGVLSSGLSGGRWRSVSGNLVMAADSLVGEGEISMETYRRVVTLCGD